MEVSQELENIKQEISNSGEILAALQKTINSIKNNKDSVLDRIEKKVDIIAETDYNELLSQTLENFTKNIPNSQSSNEDLKTLRDKVDSIHDNVSHNTEIEFVKNKLIELSETFSSVSKLDSFYQELNLLCESVNQLQSNIDSIAENTNLDLIKSKINHISTKLNEYNENIRSNPDAHFGSDGGDFGDAETLNNSIKTIIEKLENNAGFYNSSSDDLNFLKENFYRINEKFTEINLLIKTIIGESEELNNRFEKNLTHFNSCFNNIYKQFNDLDNNFNSNFKDFKGCIQDIYDQFSTIDTRNDFDNIKLYIQSFNNKITSIATVLEHLQKGDFLSKLDKISELEQKIDILANFDPTEIVNIYINSSKKAIEEINELKNSIESSFPKNNNELKDEIQHAQGKIEFLNSNICSLLDKFDNDIYEIRVTNNKILEEFKTIKKEFYSFNENSGTGGGINSKLDSILNEAKNVSLKISDEISALVSPLSSAIELSCELNNSIKEILSKDEVRIQQESVRLLDRFEDVYRNADNNFETLFSTSKHFYDHLESIKNEFSNISYDTNSKIKDFIDKTENLDLKIQSSLSNSENAVNTLKNISEFAENQININSENLHSLKANIKNLSEEFESFKTDVNGISTKLNKIIINEKEHDFAFNNYLAELKEEINKFSRKNPESAEKIAEKIIKSLSEKIDRNIELSSDNLQVSEDMKGAIAHMANWFDTASSLIEENNSIIKQNSVEKLDSSIIRTEENILDHVKRISDRLSRFEVRLESIEGKVEKIEIPNNDREVLNILSDLHEKISVINERSKSNEIIISRIESLEKKINELDGAKKA